MYLLASMFAVVWSNLKVIMLQLTTVGNIIQFKFTERQKNTASQCH